MDSEDYNREKHNKATLAIYEKQNQLIAKYNLLKTISKEDIDSGEYPDLKEGQQIEISPLIPNDPKEAFELFKSYYATFQCETHKSIFFDTYRSFENENALNTEIKNIEDFITKAEAISYKDACQQLNHSNPAYEYKRLTSGFYDDYLMTWKEHSLFSDAASVYGKYVLFYKHLKSQLTNLNNLKRKKNHFGKLPYEIGEHRLFAFDDAIKVGWHYNKGDDLEEYLAQSFQNDNRQLVICFVDKMKSADESGAIALLEKQFQYSKVRDVPNEFWLSNVEIIIQYHFCLVKPFLAKHDAVKLWFKEKRQAMAVDEKSNLRKGENIFNYKNGRHQNTPTVNCQTFNDIFTIEEWNKYIAAFEQTDPPLLTKEWVFIGSRKKHIGVICAWVWELKNKGIVKQNLSRATLAKILNTELRDFNMGTDGKTFDNTSHEYTCKFASQLKDITM